ncbi:VanZ family protein [Corynebacterium comes]|uniref:VanZ like family protein n=1 Tax=Corynebacterium comes TaxID=2675218 RepID=A0A6B8VWV9_9CORY|nr:VanZ family protein [Corynebacterium comes]QGU05824.1 VanZ like family protein [Corynebacterium comes]
MKTKTDIPRTLWPRLVYLLAAVLVSATVASLTMLKSSFSVGGLWNAQAHNRRSVDLVLFNGFVDAPAWYGPVINTVGNLALFVPVGFLVVLLWRSFGRQEISDLGWPRRGVLRATLAGATLSLGIEVAQFVFARGYSDADDILLNTLGAALGGWVAVRLRPELRRYVLGIVCAASLVVLVMMAAGANAG